MEFEKPLGHCVPQSSIKRAYTPKEARVLARGLPKGWMLSADAKSISRDFRFRDFRDAIRFINVVADLADAESHHPDMHLSYNRLGLVLSTHAVGGLSTNDFVMAHRIARIGKVERKLV